MSLGHCCILTPLKCDSLMSQIFLEKKEKEKKPCKCCERSSACRGRRWVIIGYRTTSYSQSHSWYIMRKSWQKTHKSVTTFLPHSIISSPSPLPRFFSFTPQMKRVPFRASSSLGENAAATRKKRKKPQVLTGVNNCHHSSRRLKLV